MKIGIVSQGPVARVLDAVLQASGYEVETFSQKEFQPNYVAKKGIEALLINGTGPADEGFALAVRKNVPEETRLCYLYYGPKPTYDLQGQKIEVVDILNRKIWVILTDWIKTGGEK